MVNIEDAPRLRELCEKASREYDHEKLIDLVQQINELLEKNRRSRPGSEGASFASAWMPWRDGLSRSRLARPLLDDSASGGVEGGLIPALRQQVVSAKKFLLPAPRWSAVPHRDIVSALFPLGHYLLGRIF